MGKAEKSRFKDFAACQQLRCHYVALLFGDYACRVVITFWRNDTTLKSNSLLLNNLCRFEKIHSNSATGTLKYFKGPDNEYFRIETGIAETI